MTASLFDDGAAPTRVGAPLAVRMRPRTLEELVGQRHLLEPGSPLRRLVADPGSGRAGITSVILWGPPGTGKTTLASLVSTSTGRRFVELSAVTAGVKDVREVVDRARDALGMQGQGTVLFVDEVHRFSKTQQDALLPAVENGWVTLVAATTENPSFSVISPLLSRSLVLTLASLTDDDLRDLLRRAVSDPRGLDGTVELSEEAEEHLLRVAGGDARRALTSLEAAAGAALDAGTNVVDLAAVERAVAHAAPRYDRDGDQHYDVISAFIKSCRGSDVDAALHYLARMLEAGEDPRFIARRLIILASEDVGMADPTALQTAVAAANAVQLIGLPEGRLTLAQATVAIALAPKSNAVTVAIGEAEADVRRGLIGPVPAHLRDSHYARASDLGHGVGYVYPHDVPGGVAEQQYAPDQATGRRYYVPTRHGAEARYADVLDRLRVALGREAPPVGSDDASTGDATGGSEG
ncbi:replication-associated recombination protein A [Longivirga aurantiaca]|uniref:Replication-associated recombination protein A n=1 Tax=Longivirga aurantiaca TaxID=1837743 RepID=A0ABW1T234_9ACTN